MSIILNIDTSGEDAVVSLADAGITRCILTNNKMQDHAGWVHSAIQDLLKKENLNPDQLEAVAVAIGPGSYTGLRVGLATAKGICYAKKIPLIVVGTLEIIALSVKEQVKDFVCPMIDARRDEVFTAIYDKQMTLIMDPAPLVLDQSSFCEVLKTHAMLFCGSGSKKLHQFISHPNCFYTDTRVTGSEIASLSYNQFLQGHFADLAYAEPAYLKGFYQPKVNR
jgi:tRNA threonylcarbamoyladenosine biosynthesis protein TsaB